MPTPLQKFLSSEDNRVKLAAALKLKEVAGALSILKEMHLPSRSDVSAQDAGRVVLATEAHDYQAGWHDCLRALTNLSIPIEKQTVQTLQPFDDEYVKKIAESLGRPVREPSIPKKPEPTSKRKSKK